MNLDFSIQRDKKLVVVEKSKTKLIDIDVITHLECDAYITTIHLLRQKSICVSKLLKYFEDELAVVGFIRVNNNTIVNPKYISEISSSEGKRIILLNNSKIKVSRRRSYIIKELLNKITQ